MFPNIPQHQSPQEVEPFAQHVAQKMLRRSGALSSSINKTAEFESQLNLWMHAGGPQERRVTAKARIADAKHHRLPSLNLENLQLSSLPDCFEEGFGHVFEVRLHGNALNNLPASLGELLSNNDELNVHGLTPNPDVAKVGESIVTKLKEASSRSSKTQKAMKTVEWIAPRYAERKLIRSLEKHSALIKTEQFNIMQLSTFNELADVSTRLTHLRAQLRETQFSTAQPMHPLWEQRQHTQTRLNMLLPLQTQLNTALDNAGDAKAIAPEQFDALRIQYLLTNHLLHNVLTRPELHAFNQFQHNNTVEGIQTFLNHASTQLTVDKLFARAMCCALPKQPKGARTQKAKEALDATLETLSKIKLNRGKHKQSEKHKKEKAESDSESSVASETQEENEDSASWQAELAKPVIAFLAETFVGAGSLLISLLD